MFPQLKMLLENQMYRGYQNLWNFAKQWRSNSSGFANNPGHINQFIFVNAMGKVHDSVRDGEAMAVQMERESMSFLPW